MTSLEGAGDVGQAAWAMIPIGPGITRGSRRRARNRTGDRTPARQRGLLRPRPRTRRRPWCGDGEAHRGGRGTGPLPEGRSRSRRGCRSPGHGGRRRRGAGEQRQQVLVRPERRVPGGQARGHHRAFDGCNGIDGGPTGSHLGRVCGAGRVVRPTRLSCLCVCRGCARGTSRKPGRTGC